MAAHGVEQYFVLLPFHLRFYSIFFLIFFLLFYFGFCYELCAVQNMFAHKNDVFARLRLNMTRSMSNVCFVSVPFSFFLVCMCSLLQKKEKHSFFSEILFLFNFAFLFRSVYIESLHWSEASKQNAEKERKTQI